MNYVWEAALAADRTGILRETMRYVPVRNGSPYAEVVLENLNISNLEQPEVEVNPLYRFAKVFSSVFDLNREGYEKTRYIFFDIFIQYLVKLDLRQGLSRQEYILRFFLQDMLNGICGETAAQVVNELEKDMIRPLLEQIRKLYYCGSSIYLFRQVMRRLYPDSLVYASNDTQGQILVYAGVKEKEKDQKRLIFLQEMFLPVNYRVHLFWDHHFGIVDVDETMILEEMMLF